MPHFFSSFLEILEIALVAVGAVFFIRGFLIQPFLVSGSSMVPTFSDGDYLLVDEITYRFREPERGETVVFRSPGDQSVYFIKRIIGLPGEKVKIHEGVVTIINKDNPQGVALEESYLPNGVYTRGEEEFSLVLGEYLLLGDNRSYSFDSRNWGALKEDSIVGLARIRLWPVTELQAFAAPVY